MRSPRRAARAALAFVLLAGILLGGLAQVRIETSVASFLPSADPTVEQLHELAGSFGGDPVVVLLESDQPNELLGSQRLMPLLGLEGRLSALPEASAVYGPATVLNQVAGQAQNLLVELSARREALRGREGDQVVAEFDARYGPLIVQGLPAGLPTLRNDSFVKAAVFGQVGQSRPQWRFVVPSEHAVAILVRPREGLDQAATQRFVAGVRAAVDEAGIEAERTTVAGVPVLANALGHQVQREVPLIGGIAVLAVAACFLLVPWTPRRSRRLLPVATTLLAIGLTVAAFGWLDRPLSLGVVAFLSVLLGIGSYYPTYFAQRTRPRTVFVVATATAASFGTLALSPLPFVRDLGLALALGVLLSALAGMLLSSRRAPTTPEPVVVGRPPILSGRARRVVAGVLAAGVAAGGWAALPGLSIESSPQSFAAGLSEVDEARHVEQVLGSSGELDIVLRGQDVTTPETLDWMRRAQQAVVAAHGDRMRPVISPPMLLQFLGPQPTAEQLDAGLRLLPRYLSSATIRGDNAVALLSFGVRMDDLNALRALRDDVSALLPPPPPGYHAELAGLPMVAVRGHELLSSARVLSNVLGIVAAGIVLAIGLRRRVDALRAVLAASLATGAGLLGLAVLGIPLSPVTVAFGSLTAAVGCEFTVLLCAAARYGNQALRRSVVLATAASAAGYAVLAVSQLGVIREFGLLLAASVVLAYLAARLVAVMTVRTAPLPHTSPEVATETHDKTMAGAHS